MASISVGTPLKAAQDFVGQIGDRIRQVQAPKITFPGRPEEVARMTAFVRSGVEAFDSTPLPEFTAHIATLAEEGAIYTNKKGPNRAKLADARDLYIDVADRARALQTQDIAPDAAHYVKLLLVRDLMQANELEKNMFKDTVPEQRRTQLMNVAKLAVGGLATGALVGVAADLLLDTIDPSTLHPIGDFLKSIGTGDFHLGPTVDFDAADRAGLLSHIKITPENSSIPVYAPIEGFNFDVLDTAVVGGLAGAVPSLAVALNQLVKTVPYEAALNKTTPVGQLDAVLAGSVENEAVRQQAFEIYANALVTKAAVQENAAGEQVIR